MRLYAGVAAVIAWFGLILQFVILMSGESDLSVATRAVNFFSFFTILNNLLVALVLSTVALGAGGFFARPATQAAAAMYIAVVGLVYLFLLSHIWNPQGWQLIADRVLHYATPTVYVLYWLLFAPKGALRPAHIGWFLVFPLLYVAYSLVRGRIAGWYPYYFIDAGQLGYGQVAINSAGLTLVFVAAAAVIYFVDRALARTANRVARA